MGHCGACELEPANYPAPRRYMRQSFNAEIDGNGSIRNSVLDESLISWKTPRGGRHIHVMSYNLLADHLCQPDYFTYASDQVLDFKFRGPRIIEEIASSDASMIFLQEVDRIDDFYEPELK